MHVHASACRARSRVSQRHRSIATTHMEATDALLARYAVEVPQGYAEDVVPHLADASVADGEDAKYATAEGTKALANRLFKEKQLAFALKTYLVGVLRLQSTYKDPALIIYDVQAHAVNTLGKLGEHAAPHAAELAALLADGDSWVRSAAAEALRPILNCIHRAVTSVLLSLFTILAYDVDGRDARRCCSSTKPL